ncbi:hypothetical protein AMAG_04460 [Allomyces macrogynus ATCC 38327]|uniref:Uncharacterized protein n=1 Tax=Allomyces macrogynus (strain ATCC 38327) TaxID=578462 RepID=A0A0L0S918_ALLM3|nr:hypothetical protein AMAG_04460 [Allomyces macrogynus ATCC 38327]|eukprot:KNE58926.1 hypothetical protein AMAG_04460 [Allomyces macrogynus ATCC 38327]
MAWDAPAVALAFIHIYSGWTPDQPTLPAQTPEDLHLFELAQYPQLKTLANAVNCKLISLLEEQSQELLQMPEEPVDDAPRPSKRRHFSKPGDHIDSATASTSTDITPPVSSAASDADSAALERWRRPEQEPVSPLWL